MITSRTKKQLLVFVLITLVGVSYVGARYAKLNRLLFDSSYKVTAQYKQSGGIFTGAEVTYRGVKVGQVSDMRLTKDGVDVVLDIDNGYHIPRDTLALVGNKSAVGEQYVELQPRVDKGPYLKDGSVIPSEDTAIPVSTTEILTNVDALVNSVPQAQLRTVVSELGAAFKDTGDDLGRIIDTSNLFIQAANENFDTTTALIRDSNTVLRTQSDKGSAIRSFARDLSLFSGTLAGHDASLRRLIENGSATAVELRTFLEQNRVDLGSLINNLVTTGEVTVKHLKGLRQILVMYPYEVAGGYSAVGRTSKGDYNARFGLVLQQTPPICKQGYDPKERRDPGDLADRPLDLDARCTEAITKGNARGAQNAPVDRTAPALDAPVATYDLDTGGLTWADQDPHAAVAYDGGAAQLYGEDDSWTTLLLQPAAGAQG